MPCGTNLVPFRDLFRQVLTANQCQLSIYYQVCYANQCQLPLDRQVYKVTLHNNFSKYLGVKSPPSHVGEFGDFGRDDDSDDQSNDDDNDYNNEPDDADYTRYICIGSNNQHVIQARAQSFHAAVLSTKTAQTTVYWSLLK